MQIGFHLTPFFMTPLGSVGGCHMMRRFLSIIIVAVSFIALGGILPRNIRADEREDVAEKSVTFYTTYGYKKENNWIIPLRIWVREKPDTLRRLAAKGARKIIRKRAGLARLDATQKRLFMVRAEDFIADSESNEAVLFAFDNDPDNVTFHLKSAKGKAKTDGNGLLEGFLTLPHDKVQKLLDAQNADQGWLTYRAVSAHHAGVGKVRFLAPTGVSVISDIDDTIKVTEITAGEQVVLRNTFFRDFVAAPCMAEMYQAFDHEVAFHYVSGGPWQLYGPLAQFLFSPSAGFPPGSLHMKNVRTNPFASETYHDLWKLLVNGSRQATVEQKIAQISTLMAHFPQRTFILIGDSGEHDPEIFQAIKERFSDQVQEIRIRDVVNDQENNPNRLDNMRVIPLSLTQGKSCRAFLEH